MMSFVVTTKDLETEREIPISISVSNVHSLDRRVNGLLDTLNRVAGWERYEPYNILSIEAETNYEQHNILSIEAETAYADTDSIG